MTKHFESMDGRRLAYQDTGGDGPAVLCLAGLIRNARDFAGLAAHLAPRYRVLRLDSRGRGLSEWADDPVAEYTVQIETQDAMRLLYHLGIKRTAVIGTSRGGILGMMMGAGAPGRLSCLVLNDVGPVIEPEGLAYIMSYLGRDPGFESFEVAAEALERNMGAAFPDLLPKQWLGFARTIYSEEDGRPGLSYDPRLREAVEAAMENAPADLWIFFDALRILPAFTLMPGEPVPSQGELEQMGRDFEANGPKGLPILTIRGASSNILSVETLAEMARRRPDMAHVTVANRGHVPFLDEPEAVTAIDEFLERHAT